MTLSSCSTTNKTMTNIAKDILEGEVSRLKARDVIDKLKGSIFDVIFTNDV